MWTAWLVVNCQTVVVVESQLVYKILVTCSCSTRDVVVDHASAKDVLENGPSMHCPIRTIVDNFKNRDVI